MKEEYITSADIGTLHFPWRVFDLPRTMQKKAMLFLFNSTFTIHFFGDENGRVCLTHTYSGNCSDAFGVGGAILMSKAFNDASLIMERWTSEYEIAQQESER